MDLHGGVVFVGRAAQALGQPLRIAVRPMQTQQKRNSYCKQTGTLQAGSRAPYARDSEGESEEQESEGKLKGGRVGGTVGGTPRLALRAVRRHAGRPLRAAAVPVSDGTVLRMVDSEIGAVPATIAVIIPPTVRAKCIRRTEARLHERASAPASANEYAATAREPVKRHRRAGGRSDRPAYVDSAVGADVGAAEGASVGKAVG